MSKKKIRLTESDLRNIVIKSMSRILNEAPISRVLKEVKANGLDIWAELEGKTMWVKWNYEKGKPYTKRAVWFHHEEGPLYSTYTEWHELDFALKALGVKRVHQRSYVSDWGEGDTDKFTKAVYDFSSVF